MSVQPDSMHFSERRGHAFVCLAVAAFAAVQFAAAGRARHPLTWSPWVAAAAAECCSAALPPLLCSVRMWTQPPEMTLLSVTRTARPRYGSELL